MQVLRQCGHAVHEDNPEKVTFKYIGKNLPKCVLFPNPAMAFIWFNRVISSSGFNFNLIAFLFGSRTNQGINHDY